MSWGVIAEMGYVALQTSDIERSVRHARDILGLTETHRSGTSVTMASSRYGAARELVYTDAPVDAVDRIGLVARDRAALGTILTRVTDRGHRILTTEGLAPDAVEGFAFVGPGGFVFDIYLRGEPTAFDRGPYSPDRFGHINLHPEDLRGMLEFFTEVLEFRVSDVIGDDFAYFLRCNVEHHGVALVKGRGWMHHHAWQAQSIADLARLGDRLYAAGERLLMGPVRHGAGHNIAAYYVEPSGVVVELYTDMEMIYDDDRPPVIWPAEDRQWATKWSVYDFTEFRSHGLHPAKEIVQ